MINMDEIYVDQEAGCRIHVDRIYTSEGTFNTVDIVGKRVYSKTHVAAGFYQIISLASAIFLIVGVIKLIDGKIDSFVGYILIFFVLLFVARPLKRTIPVYDLEIYLFNSKNEPSEKVIIARCYSKLQVDRLVDELERAIGIAVELRFQEFCKSYRHGQSQDGLDET
jgi:hypothetical protein